MGNYVGEIWRRMYKVNISTIPVSRREAEGGGGGGGGGGRGEREEKDIRSAQEVPPPTNWSMKY